MKLVRVEFLKGRHSCESCGHPINNLYTVHLDTGKDIVIGSECAEKLLGYSSSALLARYVNAAKREWKQQKPAPQENESREDYLTRRVAEKLNARKAWQIWEGMKLNNWYGHRGTARNRLNARGIYEPSYAMHTENAWGHGKEGQCERCAQNAQLRKDYEQALKDEVEHMIQEVETQTHANRYDFVGIPAWKL